MLLYVATRHVTTDSWDGQPWTFSKHILLRCISGRRRTTSGVQEEGNSSAGYVGGGWGQRVLQPHKQL